LDHNKITSYYHEICETLRCSRVIWLVSAANLNVIGEQRWFS